MVTTFSDLTPDALRAVLLRLPLREVAALSCVSTALCSLCAEEPLWRALCASWGAAHARSPFEAGAALRALRLRSFRSLCQVLHSWRGDPLGAWRLDTPQPAGGLVVVSLAGGGLRAVLVPSNANLSRLSLRGVPPLAQVAYTEARGSRFHLQLVKQSRHSMASDDRDTLDVVACCETALDFERMLSLGGTPADTPRFASLIVYLRRLVRFRLRRATGLPLGWSAPPLDCEPALRPGLYTASYGPHGQEVILLRRLEAGAPAEQPLPDDFPDVPRWEGVKLSGDPNVPAGRLTFLASAAEPGPDAVMQVLADVRRVVSFANPDPEEVRLLDRGVGAAHSAFGQINVQPGVWAPQWQHASLLEYRTPGHVRVGGLPVAFSALWHDADERFQFITDFAPLAPAMLRELGALEWPQLAAEAAPLALD